MCLVPNLLYLTAKFKSNNTKSWFLNNLGKLLVNCLGITVDGRVVYDNTEESPYSVYKDLWLTDKQRANMKDVGIMSENLHKLFLGDDSASKSNASDNLMLKVFGGLVKIKLGQILNDHRLFGLYGTNCNIRHRIWLPKAEDIMVAQISQSVSRYSLEDIKLEYSTIQGSNIYNSALSSYQMERSLIYNHVTMMEQEVWGKDTTMINKTINIPRQSMKYIVMLFKKKTNTDSEEYAFPSIKSVKVTVEGIPNSVYSQGLNMSQLFIEARKVFLNNDIDTLPITDFFTDKFALAIDLRTFRDNNVSGNSCKILNTQSGILVDITKEVTTTDLICYIYMLFLMAKSILSIQRNKVLTSK